MPQIDFQPENKISKAVEYDRLKLKKDEKARILLLEPPNYAWVHTLRAPKIIDGQAVKVWKDGRRGEKYLDFDLDFISRPLCLGDYGTLADKGVDTEHCPACKAASESSNVDAPERRFAMNVIRYATSRDGRLLKPFQCSCVVWSFTENIYGKLVDIAAETGGTIVGKDLVIGPCISENFQKYENYLPASQSVYGSDPGVKELVDEVFRLNRIDDRDHACGRRVERKWLDNDLKQVHERWAVANGVGAGTSSTLDAADTRDLSTEIGNMLNTSTATPTPAATDDPWAGVDATPAVAATAEEPAAATPPAAQTKPVDFQALLDQLK